MMPEFFFQSTYEDRQLLSLNSLSTGALWCGVDTLEGGNSCRPEHFNGETCLVVEREREGCQLLALVQKISGCSLDISKL